MACLLKKREQILAWSMVIHTSSENVSQLFIAITIKISNGHWHGSLASVVLFHFFHLYLFSSKSDNKR